MASPEWHWEQGIKYGIEGIKTARALNGAAAIALLTFADKHKMSGTMVEHCHRSVCIRCNALSVSVSHSLQNTT